MNKILLLLGMLCLGVFNSRQTYAQGWQWARTPIDSPSSDGQCVATDASGNVYLLGSTYGHVITFGAVTIHPDSSNLFLVKFDSSGNVIWAKSAGGKRGSVEGKSLAIDGAGDIYVAGYFDTDSLTFGTIHLFYTGGFGGGTMFLAKYDSAGNVIWAKSAAGGSNFAAATSVGTDASGNVYVVGIFSGEPSILAFDTVTLSFGSAIFDELFLVKYDPSGHALWARKSDGSYGCEAEAGIADDSGNVYVTGYFDGLNLTFGTTTITNSNSAAYPMLAEDVFLVKYDTYGNTVWAKRAGDNAIAKAISRDATGNIYVAGTCRNDNGTFETLTLSVSASVYSTDMFLAKYDPSGNALWVKGAAGDNAPVSVATDDTGNAYVAGYYSNHITFDPITLAIDSSDTLSGLYLVKYDPSGNLDWVRTANSNRCGALSMVTDAWANVFVTGFFGSNTISFGNIILSNNYPSLFVAKLSSKLPDTELQIEIANDKHTSVYPNPTTGLLTVKANYPITSISVANVLGQSLYANNYNADKVQINVAYLPNGIYFIKINGSEVRKFLKG